MDTVFTGRIWKLPDDVDTDTIIPGRYGVLPSAEEMSRHCLEPLRPELAAAARPGDIFVAGKNFGCGSSREFAPACIAALGVRCIVAKSFARIFYRNSINIGLPILECEQASDSIQAGDEIEIDFDSGVIHNLTRNESYQAAPFPPFIQNIMKNNGLMNAIRKGED